MSRRASCCSPASWAIRRAALPKPQSGWASGVIIGSDRCHQLDDPWSDGAIPLHFEQPEQAAARLVEAVREQPVRAILALGDRQTVTAAYAARILGLRYNSPESVENCRSKLRQREVSARRRPARAGVFLAFPLTEPLPYGCAAGAFSLRGQTACVSPRAKA